MAKHVILESYVFTPATSTIQVVGKNIRPEQLLLITNVTTGTVIYNFSDPGLGSSLHTNLVNPDTGQETTTIVLDYSTVSMQATDKLSILVEETYTEILPAEVMRDPVEKLRVSQPQSLIDTDFEYGTQPTKWETLNLCNNRPSAFYDATSPISGITAITASGTTVTVALPSTTGITVGTPIFVQGTLDTANADGWWIVNSVSTNTNFTYITTSAPAASLFDSTKSYLYTATFFTGAAIPVSTSLSAAITLDGSKATVTTTYAHGLQVGNSVYVVGTTGATGTLNGSWIITTTPTSNTFTFACTATGNITAAAGATSTLYVRPMGYSAHRAHDGGVTFSNLSSYHGYQVIRQTRRYFRYQSGKGIQFSTGSILKPTLNIDTITSSGTTVTVTTKYQHGLLPGAVIKVWGANETAYNGTFTVATVASPLTLTYTAAATPSATTATGFPIWVSPYSWTGSSNRIGMFDSQNGFFFEFDGQKLYVVLRHSIDQLSGVSTVTNGTNSIVGTGTKFSSQLKPSDSIVIRGQTYTVQSITSDTQMYVSPEYRGVTTSNVVISKTVDQRYPQSSWNIDKCDGTGASLLNLDLTKMQMFYADYTWYGAGGIRFGFKNNRGEVIYAHRIPNNNVNTEAYMRSGNLPARYETNTIPPSTYLTSTLSAATAAGQVISVADSSGWPSSGTLVLTQAANTGAQIEYITFSSRTANSFTIAGRAQTGGAATAQTFTYSSTAPIQVQLYSPQCASTLSHWGSSVIMDGRFDDDKSYVFNAGSNTGFSNLTANTRYALMSIRLGPSVDGGLTGLLGAREIINRMQLTLRSMDTYTTGAAFRIELLLNGKPASGTFAPVGGSSLAQVAYHSSATTITGGESIYGFFTNVGAATSQDLNGVRDIGNSILGGGTSLSVPTGANNVYPDGPDIITICCTALGSTNTINTRISWTEAQA
jgi:hypothetical protein